MPPRDLLQLRLPKDNAVPAPQSAPDLGQPEQWTGDYPDSLMPPAWIRPPPSPSRSLFDRGRVLCHGYIESVTYAPASQVAAFTAVVVDHDVPKTRGAKAVPAGSVASAVQPGAEPAGAGPAAGPRRQRPAVPKDRLRVVWLGGAASPGSTPAPNSACRAWSPCATACRPCSTPATKSCPARRNNDRA